MKCLHLEKATCVWRVISYNISCRSLTDKKFLVRIALAKVIANCKMYLIGAGRCVLVGWVGFIRTGAITKVPRKIERFLATTLV